MTRPLGQSDLGVGLWHKRQIIFILFNKKGWVPLSKQKPKRPAILVRETLALYWEQIRVDKARFFVMLCLIPLSSIIFDTVIPYLLAMTVGTFASHDTSHMNTYLMWAAIAGGSGIVTNFVGFQIAVRHEAAVRTRLVTTSLERLLAKDHEFFANQKIGALTGKFIDFINSHIGLQDLFVIRTLSFTINLIIGVVIIYMQTPLLAWIIIALLIGLGIQIRYFRLLREPIRAERKRLIAEVNGSVADTITNNLTVKTFAQEKYEVSLAQQVSHAYERAYVRGFKWLVAEGTFRHFFMQSIQIIAILVIASLLVNNTISLSIAIFAVAYLQRLAAQLFALGELINGYDKLLLQATPITEILRESPVIVDHSHRRLIVARGKIEFHDVSYAYRDAGSHDVIRSLHLTIPAGQKVGLVGVSGAGKTTIARLLLRFDDVSSGNITIDGQNIAEVTQRSLRESIAYVAQEPLLFHRSLRDNIAYSNPGASDDSINDAAKKAYALEFIEKLPSGLDTVVGERGVKLSGGQRQRIAIARAILKDAPILVLDEATSALDSESEKLIQSALSKLMQGRTSIVIAHRLSTIAKLDRIVVLDHGKIVEDGTHTELLGGSGIYAKLWSHQSGGFIES